MSGRPQGPPKLGGEWWLVAYRHKQSEAPRRWYTEAYPTEGLAGLRAGDIRDSGAADPLIYVYRVVIQSAAQVKP